MYTFTKYFGKIEYDEKDLVYLDNGLFGFEQDKEYLLIHVGDENSLFMCLQSTRNKDLSFILVNPFAFLPDYEPSIAAEYAGKLPVAQDSPVIYYSICVLYSPITDSTVNLKAPLIINTETRHGWQVMTDNPEYSFRHSFSEFDLKGGIHYVNTTEEKGRIHTDR